MKEALIQCLCADYLLPDLLVEGRPVALHRDQVVWVTEAAARQSKALAHAERVGAVSVEWRERFRVAKSPTPPWLNRKILHPVRAAPPAPVPTTPTPVVDTEEIARRAEQAAVRAATAAMDKGIAEIKDMLGAQISQEQLETALRKVLPGVGLSSVATPPEVDPDDPVYIPKGLVSEGSSASISIATEASEGGGLESAAKALKAAKPARKRTPRKRKSKTPSREK